MASEMLSYNDMRTLMAQATMNISSLGQQMGIVEGAITNIRQDINGLKARQDQLTDDLQSTKDDMRITPWQRNQLSASVKKRVNMLLGLEFEGGRVADSSIKTDLKYRAGFIKRCWYDARKKGVIEASYLDTRKRDYDRAIEFIEAWIPNVEGGVTGYKEYLDKRWETRKV